MFTQGFHIRFCEEINPDTNNYIHTLSNTLLANLIKGITDIIPSYTTLYIEYDPSTLKEKQVRLWLAHCQDNLIEDSIGQKVEIPVVYDGQDLQVIADETGLQVEEIIEVHARATYQVYALGFSAGFPFLGQLPKFLQLPRLETPRDKVPAHSVAIAGAQTGIYPTSTPGGWRLLGHSLIKIYDPQRNKPFLLNPGDKVNFILSRGTPPDEPETLELLPKEPKLPLLRVIKAGLLDLVMDEGRFLQGRFGLSRSGALDIKAAQLGNRLLGNDPFTPILEIHYQGPEFEVLDKGVLAFTGYGLNPQLNGKSIPSFTSFAIKQGDIISFEPNNEGSTAYLALAGGIESKKFAGSASVDIKNKLGRALQESDVLGVAEIKKSIVDRSFIPYYPLSRNNETTLRILATEQANAKALEVLCAKPFRVDQADRVGVRFDGEKVKGGEIISEATALGTIQITPSGQPFLLLNDRGTLGGYSKPALVVPQDLTKAAQLRSNQLVRFHLV